MYLHGTKADLAVGDLLVPGRESNVEAGRVMNYVYFTATLDAAVWGAELAGGEDRGRIYIVEPTGDFEDDPNLTDRKFPGNPTQSFRTRKPLRVVGELSRLGRPFAREARVHASCTRCITAKRNSADRGLGRLASYETGLPISRAISARAARRFSSGG